MSVCVCACDNDDCNNDNADDDAAAAAIDVESTTTMDTIGYLLDNHKRISERENCMVTARMIVGCAACQLAIYECQLTNGEVAVIADAVATTNPFLLGTVCRLYASRMTSTLTNRHLF